MFGMEQQHPLGEKHNTLHRLDIAEPMHLAPHELISPASSNGSSLTSSGYSSPTSPQVGPFTPVHTLPRQYSLPNEDEQLSPIESQQPMDYDSPTDMSLQYPAYSWEESNMWTHGQEMILGDDFDLNAIPPIELGNSKFQDEISPIDSSTPMQDYHQDHYSLSNEQYHDPHQQGSFDGLFFNDMMPSHGF